MVFLASGEDFLKHRGGGGGANRDFRRSEARRFD
jgi:hypothetical protein